MPTPSRPPRGSLSPAFLALVTAQAHQKPNSKKDRLNKIIEVLSGVGALIFFRLGILQNRSEGHAMYFTCIKLKTRTTGAMLACSGALNHSYIMSEFDVYITE